jgi:hypothetical protein
MDGQKASADVQVTLDLPVLRREQHEGEAPVERLQTMLNFVSGTDTLDVDGIFGPKTEVAVRAFRADLGGLTWAGGPLQRSWPARCPLSRASGRSPPRHMTVDQGICFGGG